MPEPLDLIYRYLARVRVQREVAEIARDDAAWIDACEAESDAIKAIQLIASGQWDELDRVSERAHESSLPPPSRAPRAPTRTCDQGR